MTLTELNAHIAHAGKDAGCKAQHLTIEGRCSIEDFTTQLTVTCKTGEEDFKKHFLGLSDNVTYFVEQLEGVDVDAFHYRVIFKPEVIIPDIDLVRSGDE